MSNQTVQLRLLHDIEEILKCKVCQERITLPLVVCRKGHCICKKCNSTAIICSVCNKFLITDHFVLLENLLTMLPKHCKACDKVMVGDSQHHKSCVYRPMRCELGMDAVCTWMGSFSKWIAHAREASHAEVTFWNGTDNLMFVQYYRFTSDWENYNMLLQFGSFFFLLYSYKSEQFLHMTVKYLGQNADFSLSIPNYCIKITFLKDSMGSFTVELEANDDKLAMCEEIPLDKLEPLVSAHHELDLYVELRNLELF